MKFLIMHAWLKLKDFFVTETFDLVVMKSCEWEFLSTTKS